jgi:uroporphyrinogen-III synthase
MNILLTRPLIDAEDLMRKFFSLGHKIIHIPTLKISAANIDPVDAKKYDAFIFTSTNAIRNLKLINSDKSKICFCVGSITEKIVRQAGYNNTISAGGTVNALKNIILNLDQIDKKKLIAYFCGDNISSNLDAELKQEGYQIDKIINYTSKKITDLNEENNKIIKNHPPDIIYIYSKRSAESFVEIVKKYALNGLMTESRVLCISEKVLSVLKNTGWKKLEVFEPGEELMKLEVK